MIKELKLYIFVLTISLSFVSCDRNNVLFNAKYAGVWYIKELKKSFLDAEGNVDSIVSYQNPGYFELYNNNDDFQNIAYLIFDSVDVYPSKIYASRWYVGPKTDNRIILKYGSIIYSLTIEKNGIAKQSWFYYEAENYKIRYKEEFVVEKMRSWE